MKKFLLAAVLWLTAIAVLVGCPASAEVQPSYRSGYWTNYVGVSDKNVPLCAMMTSMQSWGEFRIAGIKYDSGLYVQLNTKRWRLPRGSNIAVEIGFDRNPWVGQTKVVGGGDTIFISIAPEHAEGFLREVGEADQMWFRFDGYGEWNWSFNMTGSRNAMNALRECIAKLMTTPPPPRYAEVPTPTPDPAPPSQASSEAQKQKPTGWTGSGFFISQAGHLLTNAHVAENCGSPTVRPTGGTPIQGTVVAIDSKNDLALVKASTRPSKVAVLRVTPPSRTGEQVVVFGFPLGGLLSTAGNATFGNVTATMGMLDDPNHLQISASVQSGNSGGPLLDNSGNVIGVVVAKLGLRAAALTGDLPQNINFAIKSNVAASFLSEQGIAFEKSGQEKPLLQADVVDIAKAFSAEIKCHSGR